MKVWHESSRGEPINTKHGLVQLDARGFVTNLGDFKDPAVLLEVTGFVNGDLFGPGGEPATETATTAGSSAALSVVMAEELPTEDLGTEDVTNEEIAETIANLEKEQK